MSRHKTKFLTVDQLEKLTTKRLLAYRNSLYKFPEGPCWDSLDRPLERIPSREMCKSNPDWQAAMANLKRVLETREHIER